MFVGLARNQLTGTVTRLRLAFEINVSKPTRRETSWRTRSFCGVS